jgi:hypothetical protein
MPFGFAELSRDQIRIPGEGIHHTMTPYFKYENVYNEAQSRLAGKPVYDLKEMVEIRFAANPQYRPCFGVDEMQHADETGRVCTWAEYFKPQYQAFLDGSMQEADGTPLEELLPYGMSQAQLSICRALNIYSIEALHHLEGAGVKRLGVIGNDIKPMAKRFLETRGARNPDIDGLKARLAELEAANAAPPEDPDEDDEAAWRDNSAPASFDAPVPPWFNDAPAPDEVSPAPAAPRPMTRVAKMNKVRKLTGRRPNKTITDAALDRRLADLTRPEG